MDKDILTLSLVLIFLMLAIGSIIRFTSLAQAKWLDDGMDIIYGVVAIYLGVLLFFTYRATKNKNMRAVSAGLFVLAFVQVLEIHIQELQLSLNYQPPQTMLWGISYLITLVGAVLIVRGLWSVTK